MSLDLELVKPSNFQKSKTAFISVTGGIGEIRFSKFLSNKLGFTEGDHIAWYARESDPDMKFLHGIFLTKTSIDTMEVKRSRQASAFKVNGVNIVSLLEKAFRIKKNKTIRIFVDVKNPMTYKNKGEDVKVYMVYDIPPMRHDLEDDEREDYNKEYMSLIKKIKDATGINLD